MGNTVKMEEGDIDSLIQFYFEVTTYSLDFEPRQILEKEC